MTSTVPAAVLLSLLFLAAPVLASFGTQVRPGDSDFVPVTTRASLVVSVNEADLGEPGVVTDNCILLDTAAAPTAGAQREDIRLTPCLGKDAGTLISDSDVVERSSPYPIVAGANLRYVDANNNGKYDKGDPLYLTTAAAPAFPASTATGAWTLRLTASGDKPAGTFVLAEDADFATNRASTRTITRLQLARVDPKAWYLAPTGGTEAAPTPLPQYSLLPENSVRLAGAWGGKAVLKVTNLTVSPPSPIQGEPFQLTIDLTNDGAAAGSFVVSTKLDGKVVDARGTAVLDPKGKATLVATLVAPRAAQGVVEAGNVSLALAFAKGQAATRAGEETAQRVSQLEADVRGLLIEVDLARDTLQTILEEREPALVATSVGPEPPAAEPATATLGERATPSAGVVLAALAVSVALGLARGGRKGA